KSLAAAAFAALPSQATRIGDGYPQLVVRYMAAVYQRATVEFTLDSLHLGSDAAARVYRVLDPTPDAGQVLTPERRRSVLEAVALYSNASGLAVCATFAPNDAVYLRPGGVVQQAKTPPRGGLDLGEVLAQRVAVP
ncbi:MAG: hypothetical protein ACOYOB_21055, partial [Myxococcota bacterium]